MKRLLQNRKTLYVALFIMIVSIFTLSIAYAVLSTTLNITGSTEIASSSWNIYLDNIEIRRGSVEASPPEISGTSSVSFDVDLTLPGDFYEFTVDVVNDGSIDAMIDSVVKTPELTTDQAKYIKYEITYENGESINEKQTLKKETTTPIKVRIEYRKDLSVSDLPSTTTELSLGLTLVYIQSDGSGTDVKNNGVELPEDYVRLNYIESTGTQYIEANYVATTRNLTLEVKISCSTLNSEDSPIIGNLYTDGSNSSIMLAKGVSNYIYAYSKYNGASDGSTFSTTPMEANKTYVIRGVFDGNLDTKSLYVNGVFQSSSQYKSRLSQMKKNFSIFRSSTYKPLPSKVYYAKIFENDILVVELIPCYKISDNAAGLYDLVNDVFYENSGTGEFIGG